ncbi:hypothetical protein GCM10010124_30110 [Pilimelia terevasa]|uniref:Uncharacterized protein n=1 Tax=Pilimelia terevasa TaxID=53372 RepID=A0A8J3BP43_9ACTN|nr:hypothetical protein [Pilimelia terevasa]GGK35389.1 hypothetical protein GCM10010124_30110 [Pilimelia terevasa]
MSYGPAPAGAPPSRRPGTVSAATALIFLYVLLLLVGAALLAVVFPDLERAFADAAPGGSGDASGAVAGVVVGLGGCVVLVLGIAFVVLAVFAGKGRNGARVTLWVLGGLMACCGGASATGDVLGLSGLQSAGAGADLQANLPEWYRWTSAGVQFTGTLVLLCALVLLALPASNAYFRPAPEGWSPAAYPAYPGPGAPQHPGQAAPYHPGHVPPGAPPQPGHVPPGAPYPGHAEPGALYPGHAPLGAPHPGHAAPGAPPHPGYGPHPGGPAPDAPPPAGAVPPPSAPPAPPSAPPPPPAAPPAPPSAPSADREEP